MDHSQMQMSNSTLTERRKSRNLKLSVNLDVEESTAIVEKPNISIKILF